MKKLKLLLVLLLMMSVFELSAKAQRKARWIAENGFWEVITNKNDPSICTVQFYNLKSKLIYQEKIVGASLDLHKRHDCKILNRTLKKALIACAGQKMPLEDKQWVAMQIKH